VPAMHTGVPSIDRSTASGDVPGIAAPTAWMIRPQFGSAPCSAVLTRGELATARATGSTASACPPRTSTRRYPSCASPSATIMICPAGAGARRALARRNSSSLSAVTATPLEPSTISMAVSLVESCPSTETRSNERLTHTPGAARRSRGEAPRPSPRSTAWWRTSARSSPRPCTGRQPHRPEGS